MYKLRFFADFCLELTASSTFFRGSLAESAGNVIFSLFVLWFDEDSVGSAKFDQLTHIHIGGVVRYPGSLLHIVGHDQDRNLVSEIRDQFFDTCGCDWIQRRGGFIK